VLAAPALSAEIASESERPNVLFIAVDDLRPELGCYGVKEIISPNIDALADRGVTFSRAYCQQAVCNPSRVSLLTGLRPDSAKVWDLVTEFRDTVPDAVTLPEHFKHNGYYAVGMGKIFHNPFPDPQSWTIPEQPKPAGHRLYSAEIVQRLQQARAKARRAGMSKQQIGHRVRGPATDCEDVPDNQRYDGALCDLALEHLRQADSQEKPFFLAVGFILPHLPWTPPKSYWDLYDPAEIPPAANGFLPKGMPPVAFGDRSQGGMYELMDCMDFKDAPSPFDGSLTEAQQRRLKHGYYASVSFIDAQVGRLLEELDRLELTDNTIVVLWGDHGWKLGEHNGWCKQTNYEIDTRSPLLIAAPGANANGERCDALVEFVDIYPTLCELAGLPVPSKLEGVSLASLLEDATGTVKTAALSQFPRRHAGVQYMGYTMRTDRYRYVEWLRLDTAELTDVELYDEQADPHENVNIAASSGQEDLLKRLHDELWKCFAKPEPGMQLRTRKPNKPDSARGGSPDRTETRDRRSPPDVETFGRAGRSVGNPATTGSRPSTTGDRSKRPEVHFENRWNEPVAVYWIPERGPRRQVGFIPRGGRQTQLTTFGHRFLFLGAITKSEQEFTVREDGRTFVLDPKDRRAVPSDKPGGAAILAAPLEQPQDFKVTAPPAELYVDPFYKQYTSVHGYPIVASENVNDYALKEAAHLIGLMTAKRPDVLQMMIISGSRMCILGHNEYTTDLPEFAHFEPKDYWDARARGTGGNLDDPLCSCGEENLLGYPGDPYAAECILIHEFAHNIHLRGLVHLDPTFDERLEQAYQAAMEKGLWKGKYAAVNHHEYFAEGVQSWFDNNRPPDHDHNHVNTRQELIEYDPALAAICREIFGDTELKYTKPATRLHGHLAGYKPADAPTFAWPKRLKDAQEKIRQEVRQRTGKPISPGDVHVRREADN
jgi:arylsulfatase A-like enzyme